MSLQTKLAAFDHVVFKLTEWYGERNGQWAQNDLSKLKITKLLFFIAAITATAEEEGLLETFDSFAALPYGHVESQIQDHMEDSENFVVGRNLVQLRVGRQDYQPVELENEAIRDLIDQAVVNLKSKNIDLINYNQFSLVELSHRWQSWKTVFALAKRNGKFSMAIPKEMIMQEPKIFK